MIPALRRSGLAALVFALTLCLPAAQSGQHAQAPAGPQLITVASAHIADTTSLLAEAGYRHSSAGGHSLDAGPVPLGGSLPGQKALLLHPHGRGQARAGLRSAHWVRGPPTASRLAPTHFTHIPGADQI